MNQILITSLVSNKTQEPRIDITLPSNRIQLSAEEALNVAKQLIECVSGSYADSFLWNFLQEKVFKESNPAETQQKLTMILIAFREFRDKLKQDFDSYQDRSQL